MKREADKNRVKRAIEHLNAAITNLKSIKSENLEIGMMKPKDKYSLIEEIQSVVALYCYDHDDKDFEITLSVRVEDGFAKVEDAEEDEE